MRKLNAGRLTCLNPKEPPTGTQACSPCCTPTWSRRMRHWSARACGLARSAARDGAREHAALGAIRSGTRNAKWARGSRSQTHRRAAKGGFTQTTVRWSEGLVPDRRPPRLFLFCSKSSDCSWVLKLGPWYLVPILPVTVLRVKPIAGEYSREHCPRVYAICRPELG